MRFYYLQVVYMELNCITWVLECLKDLHVPQIEIVVDNSLVMKAIQQPRLWLKYRSWLLRIANLKTSFETCRFYAIKESANGVV